MDQTWTIKSALDWTIDYLARKGDVNPRLSAEWLMSEATGHSRIQLYVSFDQPLSPEEREKLREYVSRRGKGEPLQYITGHAAFRYITVKVRPGVLIPRPETEVLVSVALTLLPAVQRRHALDSSIDAWEGDAILTAKALAEQAGEGVDEIDSAIADVVPNLDSEKARPLLVADICTGSGCIACAIASEREDARLFATDISSEAVSLARENAEELGLSDRVRVEQGDLGAPMPSAAIGKLDLVISNRSLPSMEVPTATISCAGCFRGRSMRCALAGDSPSSCMKPVSIKRLSSQSKPVSRKSKSRTTLQAGRAYSLEESRCKPGTAAIERASYPIVSSATVMFGMLCGMFAPLMTIPSASICLPRSM